MVRHSAAGQQQVGKQLIGGGAIGWLGVNHKNCECSKTIWSLTLKKLHRFNESSKWQILTVLLPKEPLTVYSTEALHTGYKQGELLWRDNIMKMCFMLYIHDIELPHSEGERVHMARQHGEKPHVWMLCLARPDEGPSGTLFHIPDYSTCWAQSKCFPLLRWEHMEHSGRVQTLQQSLRTLTNEVT